jgi:hypothetical protein
MGWKGAARRAVLLALAMALALAVTAEAVGREEAAYQALGLPPGASADEAVDSFVDLVMLQRSLEDDVSAAPLSSTLAPPLFTHDRPPDARRCLLRVFASQGDELAASYRELKVRFLLRLCLHLHPAHLPCPANPCLR